MKEFELLRRNFSDTGNFGELNNTTGRMRPLQNLYREVHDVAPAVSLNVWRRLSRRLRSSCGSLRVGPSVLDSSCSQECVPRSGFGINEHIDLGIKYDPSSGIYGVFASLAMQT